MASFGIGTASHLAGELLKQMAGINMVHVPYRGGALMITDLLAGQVQIGFDVMVTSLPHVRTGALRALAVAGSRRFEALPEVPTIAEALPGYEARTWAGVGAPQGYARGRHRTSRSRNRRRARGADDRGATRRSRHGADAAQCPGVRCLHRR
jgi:tripartite-type tricarboxylate transporter receptor subunit TctC